jgi:hypothetical protein
LIVASACRSPSGARWLRLWRLLRPDGRIRVRFAVGRALVAVASCYAGASDVTGTCETPNQ